MTIPLIPASKSVLVAGTSAHLVSEQRWNVSARRVRLIVEAEIAHVDLHLTREDRIMLIKRQRSQRHLVLLEIPNDTMVKDMQASESPSRGWSRMWAVHFNDICCNTSPELRGLMTPAFTVP
jgi:hypothetical protein